MALPLAGMIFAAAPSALAQEVIDGGAVITVPGDHSSPWELPGALIVGQSGAGDLTVETGGVVTSVGGVIGDEAAGDGLVMVTDAGSRWSAGALTVGYEGWAALGIFDGGLVESLDTVVGDQLFSLGDVLVEGPGSAWAVDGALTLGREGEAYLQILDGGRLTAGDVVFGELFDGTGEALLSGAGSRLEADSLVIGDEGLGALTVSDGAVLSVGGGAGTIVLGQTVDGEGLLSIGGDCGCGPGAPDAPGTIDAALIQFGDGGGELGFNHTSTDYVFDAEIAGFGLLSFYSGTTTLTADSSGFAGFAGLLGSGGPDSPHLIVDGVLGGDPGTGEGAVLVLGGILSGAGTINGPVLVGPDGVLRGVPGQTLTIGGLLLDPDAILEVDLSDPSAPALFDVVTDVELDGVLDLTSAPGSGPGAYRIMSYGGSLTDHDLDIGATPVGVDPLDLAVQTAIAGQVNLVSGAGAGDLVFWDGGDAGLHDNGSIDGGDGVWSATDPNWTDVAGSSNGAMNPQPGFAIFQAAPGTVTVDDGAGAVSAAGMQFASDGYVVAGDAIGLTEAESVIRVGDGTGDGAGFTAVIASALTGAGGLRKTDLGTLILTGDSTYAGGTFVHGGLLRVDGGSLGVDGQDVEVGAAGGAALEIVNGGVVTGEDVHIGNALDEGGQVTVSGVGSRLISDSDLNVGRWHDGTLIVEDGGVVQAAYGHIGSGNHTGTGDGVLIVTGAGSRWDGEFGMSVGRMASGTVTVEDGGAIQLDTVFNIGSGSDGLVTITGAGSTLDVGSVLTAGFFTDGELQIEAGAAVTSVDGVLGFRDATSGYGVSNGEVTVTGAGSSWTVANELTVGLGGDGLLTIADGGDVTTDSATVGQETTATGAIAVGGAGSTLTVAGELILGFDGVGTLSISDGGYVAAASLILGHQNLPTLTGDGRVEVTGTGSILDVDADIVVGELGLGELTVSDGGVVRVDGGVGTIILGQTGFDAFDPSRGDLVIGGGGAAPLAPGTIDAARVEFGSGFNAGSIVFNHNAGDYAFAAEVVGGANAFPGVADHTLVFSAGGTRLTADSSGFTGDANIQRGAGVDASLSPHLMLDGALGGDVHVGSNDPLRSGVLSGSGSIAGTVTVYDFGTLIGSQGQTLTMGGLTLTSGATIDARLGAPGGDELFDVVGDLTLDGTVDVSDVGGFGEGVYSLITYGGALTDNGLDVGSTPMGATMLVQTSVAGHVYLVSAGGDLLFWDGGDAGDHNNGAVDGGDGVWTAASPTWTDMDGLYNGPMTPQPGFAVFQGAAGTVTLDDSAGALAVTGMQFAVDGYRLEGDALELADAQTTVQVGDGTAAGAGFTATIASQITGAGALVKTDLGTLVLTGDSSAFGGGTFVNEGLLLVNGSLGGLVTVEDGGAVGGSGQFGSITLGDGAVVSPGNSIGTLNLAGDMVFNAGSVYEVEVDPGGTASDLIHAGGTATLGDATVQHIGLTGDYAPFQTYTILTADGGLIGTFGTVTSDFAFLDPSLTYDANNVYLTLVRNDATFASVGGTPNQVATGSGVEPLGFGNPVWDAAIMLSAPEARAAFDQLSGEIHASAHTVAIGQGERLYRMLVDQVRLDRAPARGVGLWAQAWGALGRTDADGNAAGLRQESAGLLVGAEGRLGAGWTVGVAAGAETGELRSLARRSEGETDAVHLAAYAGGAVGPLGLRLGASHSRHQFDIDRTVDIPGFSDALAAEYDATSTQLFAEAGYALRWGETAVEPFAAVAHIDLDVDGFSESGGAAALTAEAEDQRITLATLGVGMARDFDNGAGRRARLHGRAGWRHASGDVTPRTRFTLAGGTPFAIAGAPLAEDALAAEVGLDVRSGALTAGVVWSGQAGGGAESHSLQGRLSWTF